MKTKVYLILLISIIVLTNCSSNCSHNNDSIEFMEIPIDGNVNTFGDKLSQKGYTFYTEDTTYHQLIYYGIYLNKQATIRLDYEEGAKNITSARVVFQGDLPNTTALINEYTEKYGKCSMDTETELGFIYYSWEIRGGKLTISTCSSPIVSIEYYKSK